VSETSSGLYVASLPDCRGAQFSPPKAKNSGCGLNLRSLPRSSENRAVDPWPRYAGRTGKRKKDSVCGIRNGDADVGLDRDWGGLVSRPVAPCGARTGSDPRDDWSADLRAARARRLGDAAADSRLDRTEGAAAARTGEVVARRSADAAPLVFDVSRGTPAI